MRTRLLASGLFISILVLTGCVRSAAPPTPAPQAKDANAAGDRITVREPRGFALIDSLTGSRERVLPLGVLAADWSTLYAEDLRDGKTIVRAFSVATGQPLRETALDGFYHLPSVGLNGMPAGLSPDGRWLALYAADRAKSRYVVLDTNFTQAPKRVELDGNFTYDALSNDGNLLFLIQYVAPDQPNKYQVRAYDLGRGALRPQAVVDKTAGQPIMQGERQATVASPDGQWLFSLYLNASKGPFIHALNVSAGFASCIFLPRGDGAYGERDFQWSMAMTPDGSRLFAANGALGKVAEIDTGQLRVRRQATLPGSSATPAPRTGGQANPLTRIANWLAPEALAKDALAKQAYSGEAALTPDGRILFVPVDMGIVAINTSDFSLRGRHLTDWRVDSMAVSPDGARVYAVNRDFSRVLRLDLATGVITKVPGAVHPLAVLRVEAKASR